MDAPTNTQSSHTKPAVVPQPPNIWTHRPTHNLHIPNQQHTVYRCSWGWTCRSETSRAVKHIVNKYSTITKVVYLVGLHMQYLQVVSLNPHRRIFAVIFEGKRRKKITCLSNIVYWRIIKIRYNFSVAFSPVRTERLKNSDMKLLPVR